MSDPLLDYEPPSTIKLARFTDQPPIVGAHSTFRECFETHVLPSLIEEDIAPATIVEYANMLTHWERLTSNPPVRLITRKVIKDFRDKLLSTNYRRGKTIQRKRSTSTINKIMRTLRAALGPLWPADRHNTGGMGFLPFFKWLPSLARQKKLPFTFSRRQLSSLYVSCDACMPSELAHHKSKMHDPLKWQTAIVLALNTGPRTWDLFALKWEDIRFDDFRYGSIWFRSRKTAKLQRVPLNRTARRHLDHLRKLNPTATRVFPGFSKNDTFYNAWKRICQKAGVVATFESFRKTCSTMHSDVSAGVGAWITGHDVRGVNAESYDNPTKRVLKAIYKMVQPCEFRRGAKSLGTTAS